MNELICNWFGHRVALNTSTNKLICRRCKKLIKGTIVLDGKTVMVFYKIKE